MPAQEQLELFVRWQFVEQQLEQSPFGTFLLFQYRAGLLLDQRLPNRANHRKFWCRQSEAVVKQFMPQLSKREIRTIRALPRRRSNLVGKRVRGAS